MTVIGSVSAQLAQQIGDEADERREVSVVDQSGVVEGDCRRSVAIGSFESLCHGEAMRLDDLGGSLVAGVEQAQPGRDRECR